MVQSAGSLSRGVSRPTGQGVGSCQGRLDSRRLRFSGRVRSPRFDSNARERSGRDRALAFNLLPAFGSQADAAGPLVLEAAAGPTSRVKAAAIYALAEIHPDHPKALAALIDLLQDKDSWTRASAAAALAGFGAEGKVAVPALIPLLSDKLGAARNNAAVALGAIGPAARPAVTALALLLHDPDGDLRIAAATALRKIDPAAAEQAGVGRAK